MLTGARWAAPGLVERQQNHISKPFKAMMSSCLCVLCILLKSLLTSGKRTTDWNEPSANSGIFNFPWKYWSMYFVPFLKDKQETKTLNLEVSIGVKLFIRMGLEGSSNVAEWNPIRATKDWRGWKLTGLLGEEGGKYPTKWRRDELREHTHWLDCRPETPVVTGWLMESWVKSKMWPGGRKNLD